MDWKLGFDKSNIFFPIISVLKNSYINFSPVELSRQVDANVGKL